MILWFDVLSVCSLIFNWPLINWVMSRQGKGKGGQCDLDFSSDPDLRNDAFLQKLSIAIQSVVPVA